MPNTYNFLDENGLLYYSLLIKTELDKKLESADLTSAENKIPSTITIIPNPNNVSLALTSTNGTGTATTFPIVDTTNSGAMSPSMLTKLNTLPSNIIDGTNIALYQMTVGNIYSKDGKIYIPKTNGGSLGSFDVIEISKDGIYEKSYNSNSGNSSSVEIYDKNIIEQILLAGTTITPTNKTVNIPLATESQDGLISKDNVTRLNKTLVNDKTYIGLPWNNANVNPATLFNLDSQSVAAKTGFYIPINYINETSTLFLLESSNEFLSSTGKYYSLIPQYDASYGSYPFMFITSDSRLFFITKESSTTVTLFYLSYNSLKYRLGGNGVWEPWDNYFSVKANLSSPTFKGTPKAPTPTSGDNSTKIATTAFVQSAISGLLTIINNGIQTISNYNGEKLNSGVYYDSTNKHLLIANGNDLLTIDGGGGGLCYDLWDSSNNSYVPAGCLGELSSSAQSNRVLLSSKISNVDESQVYINSATTSVAGVMSASDKNYLDIIKNAVYNLFFLTPSSTIEIHFDENNRNVNLFDDRYVPTDPPSIWISPAAPNSNASSGIFLFDGGNEIYFFTGGTIIKGTYNNNTNSWDEETIFSENILAAKAPLASPAFTGTPTAPTPASGTNNTQIATTAFVQSAIAAAVTGSFKFVNTLPVTGEEGYIYLVPHTHTSGTTSSNPDVKDEYIWNTSTTPALWELIGNTDLDLSTHWSKSELTAATNNEILAIWNSVWTTNGLENNG